MLGTPQVILSYGYGDGAIIRFSSFFKVGKNVITYKRTIATAYPINTLAFIGSNVQGAKVTNIKLEIGNKATSYIPNILNIPRIIDPTILNEDVCANEFWIDADGITRKQVYQQTFFFRTNNVAGGDYVDRRAIYSQIKIINVQCALTDELGDNLSLSDYSLGNTNENKRWFLELYVINNTFVYTIVNPILFDKVVSVTIKYTKV